MPAGYPEHIPELRIRSTTGYIHSKPCTVVSASIVSSNAGAVTFRNGSTNGAVRLVLRHVAADMGQTPSEYAEVFGSKIYATLTGTRQVVFVRFFKRPDRTTV